MLSPASVRRPWRLAVTDGSSTLQPLDEQRYNCNQSMLLPKSICTQGRKPGAVNLGHKGQSLHHSFLPCLLRKGRASGQVPCCRQRGGGAHLGSPHSKQLGTVALHAPLARLVHDVLDLFLADGDLLEEFPREYDLCPPPLQSGP